MDSIDVEKAIAGLQTTVTMVPILKSMKGLLKVDFNIKCELDKHLTPNINTMLADGRVDVYKLHFSGNKKVGKLSDRIKMAGLKMLHFKDFYTLIKVAHGRMFIEPFPY